jgi:hypothetical protein
MTTILMRASYHAPNRLAQNHLAPSPICIGTRL